MKTVLLIALLATFSLQAQCRFYQERLSRRLELRPENDLLQEHIWPWGTVCRPRLEIKGAWIEEREADIVSKKRTTGELAEALFVIGASPLGKGLIAYAHGGFGSERQQNLPTRQDNYNVEISRVGGAVRAQLPCCFIVYGGLLYKEAHQRARSVFPFQATARLEPTLLLRSCIKTREMSAAYFRDSFVVRDTVGGISALYSRQRGLVRYEKIYCYPHRGLGVEGQILFYQNGPSNTEQRASVWYRTGFPGVERNIFFRYQFDYRRFDKTVTQYLSFNHRVAHSGLFTWACPISRCGSLCLQYNFIWMRTRELNDPGQQTRSDGQIVPAFIFKQTATANRMEGWLEYRVWRLCLRLGGAYFFDKTHYYAWRFVGAIQGQF